MNLNPFKRKHTPVRLYKKESWRERHEPDLILLGGALVVILMFLFAFCFVGQMDPYYNGVMM